MTQSINGEPPHFSQNLACLGELDDSVDWPTVDPSDSIFLTAAFEGTLTTAHVFAYLDLRFPNPKGEVPIRTEYRPKSRPGRYSKKEIMARAAQQQSLLYQEEINYKKEREASLRILLPLVEASYTKLLALTKNGTCPDFLQNKYEGGNAESFERMVHTLLSNLRETYACYLNSEVEA